MRRVLIFAFAITALLLGFVVYESVTKGSPPSAEANIQMGGPFHLIDQNGHPVSNKDLLGKPTVMFFGFTYCPDVCPTTLADMSAWLKALGPDADKLNVVYITIDPERDTPARLKSYLTAFDPRIRGLTGSPAAIAQAAHEYHVYYQKVPLQGGDYTMDHSTLIYLMDAKGRMAELVQYGTPKDDVVASLKRLLHPA